MHISILFCLVAAAAALPQSHTYRTPNVHSDGGGLRQTGATFGNGNAAAAHFIPETGSIGQESSHSIGSGNSAVDVTLGGSGSFHVVLDEVEEGDDNDIVKAGFSNRPTVDNSGFGEGLSQAACDSGLVRQANGSCVQPEVVRNIFLYNAPTIPVRRHEQVAIPTPKLFHNIVFVRIPQVQGALEPVIVPPPQQKTLVYVLTKKQDAGAQRIIEVPSTPDTPEVFYISVDDESNPQLPIGIDLQSALAAAASQQGQLIEGGASKGTSLGSETERVGLGAGARVESLSTGAEGFGLESESLIATNGAASGSLLSVRGDNELDFSDVSFGAAAIEGGVAVPSQTGGYSLPQPSPSFNAP